MFKSGRTVYNGSLPLRASSGTIELTKAFDLQVEGALVNGATVSDLTTFANQGFFYDETRQVLYYPLTKDNRSIVLVYRNVTPATTGTASAATDLSFRITSSAYTSFEIEGIGLSDGKLYFNTNRANANGANDCVQRIRRHLTPGTGADVSSGRDAPEAGVRGSDRCAYGGERRNGRGNCRPAAVGEPPPEGHDRDRYQRQHRR
jgi:hypothetical protein